MGAAGQGRREGISEPLRRPVASRRHGLLPDLNDPWEDAQGKEVSFNATHGLYARKERSGEGAGTGEGDIPFLWDREVVLLRLIARACRSGGSSRTRPASFAFSR